MKRLLSIAILVLATVMFSSMANASASEAKKFVKDIGDDALKIAAHKDMSVKEKEQKLVGLFTDVVDTQWIARFALGKYWKVATAEQKEKYLSLYQKFLVASYVPKFKQYTNETLDVSDAVQDGNGEYIVKTEIVRPGEPSIRIDYKVRKTGNNFKVFDIVAEGVSLITTQRSEFSAVVSRKGMDFLLERLAASIEKMAIKRAHLLEDVS